MVKVEYAVKVLRDFLELNGPELLPLKIVEIGKEHNEKMAENGFNKMSDKDSVIIGLRYYEFLADNTSDEGYSRAIALSEGLLTKFGIDYNWLAEECKKLGWH